MPILNDRAQIKKVSIKHDAIMDYLLVNPTAPLKTVAYEFGVTQAWLSTIIHSDAFQIQLATKKNELFNGTVLPLREKVVGLAHAAVEKLGEKLERSEDPAFVLESTDKILHRLGWAPQRVAAGTNIQQNNFYTADKETLARARNLMNAAQEKRKEEEKESLANDQGRLLEHNTDTASEAL
jgi:hypothetical protein